MFRRTDVGEKPRICDKCGSEKVYFVQHAHGNYPILDYMCPKCDIGVDKDMPGWWTGEEGERGE